MGKLEERVFKQIGERHLKNRENSMGSPVMMIHPDKLFAEVGKMHLQLQNVNEQLQAANRQIAELDSENRKLKGQLNDLSTPSEPPHQPEEGLPA